MSMRSLTDSLRRRLVGGSVRRLGATATATVQVASLVDASVRDGDFSWQKPGSLGGTNRGIMVWPSLIDKRRE
jgi:hypothetical protein